MTARLVLEYIAAGAVVVAIVGSLCLLAWWLIGLAERPLTAEEQAAVDYFEELGTSAPLPPATAPGPDRAGGSLTSTPFAPVTTAPSGPVTPVKGDSAGPGVPDVSRPGPASERLPAASEGPHQAGTPRAAGPGQDAERRQICSITGAGRHRWLRRDPQPVNFHTTAMLQAACATDALLALAETVLAVTG